MTETKVFEIPKLATVTIVKSADTLVEDKGSPEYESWKMECDKIRSTLPEWPSRRFKVLPPSEKEERRILREQMDILDTLPDAPMRPGKRTHIEIRLDSDYSGDLNSTKTGQITTDEGLWFTGNCRTERLDRFMEVLTHHDYTGDGEPDCDEIIDAIEEVVKGSAAKPFVRPDDNWFSKLCMSIMPPAPERHVVFGFDDLKPHYRWYHTVAAIPLFILVIGLVIGQIALLPFMHYSVITGLIDLSHLAGLPGWAGIVALMLIVFGSGMRKAHEDHQQGKESSGGFGHDSYSSNTMGFFNKAAVYEEQVWREGSENWTMWQRVRSCFSFGAIHMANLIYPLAAVLPLAIGGGLFMYVYLRTLKKTGSRRAAVLQSSVWHRVYNRIALTAFAIQLVLLLVLGAYQFIS